MSGPCAPTFQGNMSERNSAGMHPNIQHYSFAMPPLPLQGGAGSSSSVPGQFPAVNPYSSSFQVPNGPVPNPMYNNPNLQNPSSFQVPNGPVPNPMYNNPNLQNPSSFQVPNGPVPNPMYNNPNLQNPSSFQVPNAPMPNPNYNSNLQNGYSSISSSQSMSPFNIECPIEYGAQVIQAIQSQFQVQIVPKPNILEVHCTDNQIPRIRAIAAQKIKELTEIGNMKWGWLNDKGEIIQYSDLDCRKIETEYQKKSQSVEIVSGGNIYSIKFGNPHTQRLKNSIHERTVRRLDGTDTVNEVIGNVEFWWQWREDNGKFYPYTAEANRQLESAYGDWCEWKQCNQQQTYATPPVFRMLLQGSNKSSYLVDFETMNQMNEVTSYKRQIKRVRKSELSF